ncbi:GGDEF domain-containing protein [Brucepastera parasyntrophica]|uniref:GGDEF domain-containing protein n=1 Tax=Brucepastera parasyntrophica TaxID=2880008 RepID=UPI002108B7EE|nr:GGDEF domain-containing protein [Brucepastera parasyntrophica]ULQ58672.1 GGDEF domain-containing protein [Brucepastera parasyntrophica]
MITYSVPLIHTDGYVFGVLGVDIAVTALLPDLNYSETETDKKELYILALTDAALSEIEIVCANTLSNDDTAESIRNVFGERKQVDENVFSFDTGLGVYFGSIQPLSLYASDTPYAGRQWVLIGLDAEKDLLAFSDRMQLAVYIVAAICLVWGLFVIAFASRKITDPIKSVVNNLNHIDPYGSVVLQRTDIAEIDELSQSIEDLSHAVADCASVFSNVISMTKIPIAVFMMDDRSGTVQCSSNLYRILDSSIQTDNSGQVAKQDFLNHLEKIEGHIFSADDNKKIYKIPDGQGTASRWLQLVDLKEGLRTYGTVTDITNEMEEKQKITYERDYDQLTCIYNRRGFRNFIDDVFFPAIDVTKVSALLMFDLDNLKHVNDTYGHEIGDKYIVAFADGLREFEKYNATIVRRSGDEFFVVFMNFDTKEQIHTIIDKVFKNILHMYLKMPDGTSHPISASGGLSWYPEDTTKISDWLNYADFAMYNAKYSGTPEIQEFNREEYLKSKHYLEGRDSD